MDGTTVRDLLRRATTAALGTLDAGSGHPYVSLVEVATMPDARPVLLLSGLARHTRNLAADPRASLLVDQRHAPTGPLTAERTTIVGRAEETSDPTARRRYLARHAAAEQYADFGDFRFWLLEVCHAHTIAGFGRIREIAGCDVVRATALGAWLAAEEKQLVARVNGRIGGAMPHRTDHPGTLQVIGIDEDGIDVRTPEGLVRVAAPALEMDMESASTAIAYAVSRGL